MFLNFFPSMNLFLNVFLTFQDRLTQNVHCRIVLCQKINIPTVWICQSVLPIPYETLKIPPTPAEKRSTALDCSFSTNYVLKNFWSGSLFKILQNILSSFFFFLFLNNFIIRYNIFNTHSLSYIYIFIYLVLRYAIFYILLLLVVDLSVSTFIYVRMCVHIQIRRLFKMLYYFVKK